MAGNICPCRLPETATRLRAHGATVVPHGVALGTRMVTEHIAFIRAAGPPTGTPINVADLHTNQVNRGEVRYGRWAGCR